MDHKQYYEIGKYVQKHVRKIAQRTENFNAESLCGGCAIAAVLTHRILQQLNVTSIVIEAQYEGEWGRCCHCWTETVRYVIDPTSIQFNKRQTSSWPDVIVLPRQDYYRLRLFPKTRTLARGREALNNISTWYIYQNPKNYKEELDTLVIQGVEHFRNKYN